MAFIVYEKKGEQEGLEVLEVKYQKVAFGGNRNGVLYKYLAKNRKLCEVQSGQVFRWKAEASALLAANFDNAQNLRLVVDLKPNVEGNISLYLVRNIWGFTYPAWTPVMLELNPLFVDVVVPESKRSSCKQRILFDPDPRSREPVFDFFYLQGGYANGNWNPGQLGGYNGALLWPDAADYFSAEMRRILEILPSSANEPRHSLPCKTQ